MSRIVILNRIPNDRVKYQKVIDHNSHQVLYIGHFSQDYLFQVPATLIPADLAILDPLDLPFDIHQALLNCDLLIARGERDLVLAARIRELYDIPGDTIVDVLPIRDKLLMRQMARKAGIMQPAFWPLVRLSEARPRVSRTQMFVLKPRLDAASNGVRVGTYEDIADAAKGLSSDDWLVESFVAGDIYHLDGVIEDGTLRVFQASKYLNTCLSFASGTPLGSVQIPDEPWMFDAATAIASALRYPNGSFHLEMILCDDGEPYFLEFAGRVAGAYIAEAFERKTGINLHHADLGLMLGNPMHRPPHPAEEMMFGWFLYPYGAAVDADHIASFKQHLVMLHVNRHPIRPAVPSYLDVHSPLGGVVASSAGCEEILLAIIEAANCDRRVPIAS